MAVGHISIFARSRYTAYDAAPYAVHAHIIAPRPVVLALSTRWVQITFNNVY